MPRAAVAVLGEALVDEFPGGERVAGGAPFNVARWLAVLGLPTLFVSRIGNADAGAQCVLEAARLAGLDPGGLQVDLSRPTGRVCVSWADGGHRFAISDDAAWDHLSAIAAVRAVRLAAPRVVVFGSLGLRHAVARPAIVEAVASTDALRLADLNLRTGSDTPALAAATLELAHWVKLNDEELERVRGWFVPDAPSQGEALRRLAQRFALRRLIVTCGERGWYSVDADGRQDASGPAVPQSRLIDAVGAGDAFTAVMAAGIACDWPLSRTLAAAAQLGSRVCGVRGALPAERETLTRWRSELGFDEEPSWPTGALA